MDPAWVNTNRMSDTEAMAPAIAATSHQVRRIAHTASSIKLCNDAITAHKLPATRVATGNSGMQVAVIICAARAGTSKQYGAAK